MESGGEGDWEEEARQLADVDTSAVPPLAKRKVLCGSYDSVYSKTTLSLSLSLSLSPPSLPPSLLPSSEEVDM